MALEGLQISHYRLQNLIGSGGMGEVYLAEDTRIARKVAIKVVRNELNPYPNAQSTKDAMRLFEREMRAITTLDHPNILPLFDFGEDTVSTATFTYMVMPFRQEGSLVDWLHQQGGSEVLPQQEVVHIVRQAASALQHAHNHHILHLDVKPSNFLIRRHEDAPRYPNVLLADFGIAKFTSATATASQSIRGTPGYMAPEQWAAMPVEATDQYALAVMIYLLLTGTLPFQGSLQQVMYKHLQERPQPPSMFNPRIPPAVDSVILQALAKKPEERFLNVQAFATAFEQAWQEVRPPAPPPTYYPDTPPPPPPTYTPTYTPTYAPPTVPSGNAPPYYGMNAGMNTGYGANAGQPPYQYPVQPSAPMPQPQKRSTPWLAVVIGLVVLVLLGGVGIAFATHQSPTTNPGGGSTDISTPTPSPTPAIPQLKSSYTGTTVAANGGNSTPMDLFIDSQDQQGHLTARLVYHGNSDTARYTCSGSIDVQKHLVLDCSGYQSYHIRLDGNLFPDGHLQGTDNDNYTWNVS